MKMAIQQYEEYRRETEMSTSVDDFVEVVARMIKTLEEESGVEVRRIKVVRVSTDAVGVVRRRSVVKGIELEMS